MPQRDVYHEVVKAALIGDGWIITHDPLVLSFGHRNVYADLGAEQPIGAERGGEKIAVEVKSFLGPSAIRELEQARLGTEPVRATVVITTAPGGSFKRDHGRRSGPTDCPRIRSV